MTSRERKISLIALLAVTALVGATPAFADHHRPRVSVHVYGGFGFGYPYSYFAPVYPYPGPYPVRPPDYALVDTDVSPEEAWVYLDGEKIGTADDFDGFPDYLDVSPGRHVLEFRSKDYRTLRVNLYARAGMLYRIDRKLRRGEESESDQQTYGSPRDEPSRRRHAMRDRDDRRPDRDDESDTLRDRPREGHDQDDEDRRMEPPSGNEDDDSQGDIPEEGWDRDDEAAPEPPPSGPRAAEPALLMLTLKPEDGAVYIDGRFVGTGESLEGAQGWRLEPGRHTVEVVKPGYAPYKSTIDLRGGEKRRLTVGLQSVKGKDL